MPGRSPVSLLMVCALLAPPLAAQDWLELHTDRFTVVSQLTERDTREWATEFDRFVDALHTLLPLNEKLLPPLTAVLFRRSGGFSPYRIRTESGTVGGNSGVFINYSTWSLIGMPGVRGASEDHSTTYHEAVHWFMSADPASYPLWFREGIAELFSTFAVEDGMARWGQLSTPNLDILLTLGLQPMEEFLAVTQDQAMHVNATYYSQASLFLHYLLFGPREDGPALLGAFLRNSQSREPIDAYRATFDIDLETMDRTLSSYARGMRFNVATAPIDATGNQALEAAPASAALVELSLARLAFGTGNFEPLAEHLERLLAIDPESAEAYDLRAAWQIREQAGDPEALLDAAIARGSRDARTFQYKAVLRIEASRGAMPLFSSGAYEPGEARRIAGYLARSANLLPTNLDAFALLSDVLYSVDEVLESDVDTLALGAAVHPNRGVVPIGQAAIALANGDEAEAARLVELALGGGYELDPTETRAARALLGRLSR